MLYKIILYIIFFFVLLVGLGKILSAEDRVPLARVNIVEKVTKIYGTDTDMIKIIGCESGFRQFNSGGNPLISPTSDVGIMQINQVHWERAKNLGLDIFYSIDDNLLMGYIIYIEQGKSAWTCNKLI